MKIFCGCATLLLLAASSCSAAAQVSDDVVKIGVIVDMTGPYADLSGPAMVRAVEMAVKDFGGSVLGRPIEVVSANYQNKVDVAASTARSWYDTQKVDLIIEASDSAAAIAMNVIAAEKKKPIIFAGSITSALTNKACTAYGIQWTYNTYALAAGTAAALADDGKVAWYFITANYALGESLEADATRVLKSLGGRVIGTSKHSLNDMDYAAILQLASSSPATVVGFADAGKDLQNAIRQSVEFGLTSSKTLAALALFDSDIRGMGLDLAQGLKYMTAFYWDRNPETREFSMRFNKITGRMPNMNQAGAYSATLHYLKAIEAAQTDATDPVLANMRATPVNDVFAKNGEIRIDGQMVHEMYLAEVKRPNESTSQWDVAHIRKSVPGKDAFQSLSDSTCPLVANKK